MSLLLAFLGAPVVWAVHLAVSYFLVALDCGTDWNGARVAVLLVTALCALAAAGSGVYAWRGGTSLDPPQVREFLVRSGAILAALFAGVIILSGMAPLFLPMCS